MDISIAVITYNQERYIAEALESILCQQSGFECEIIIGEDCSTDNTRHIIEQFQQQYPDKIRAVFRDSNVGMNANFLDILQRCRGKYVAILEGDDFWTSPKKLQMQYDFMEQHPDAVLSFHNVAVQHEASDTTPGLFYQQERKSVCTLEDLLGGNFIQLCSVMYRNKLIKEFPRWMYSAPLGDWPLFALIAQHGKLMYMNVVLATYRVHSGGVWSSRDRIYVLDKSIEVAHRLNDHFKFRYDDILSNTICKWCAEKGRHFNLAGDVQGVNKAILECKNVMQLMRLRSNLPESDDTYGGSQE